MPLMDSRTPQFPTSSGTGKKRLGSRDRAPADPGDVIPELQQELCDTIRLVLAAGGAVLFGTTRDGTSLLVRAWIDGDRYEDYYSSVGEMTATLEALRDVAEAVLKRHPTPLR